MQMVNASLGRIVFFYIPRMGTGSLFLPGEPLGLNILAAVAEENGWDASVFSGTIHEAAAYVQQEMDHRGLDVVGLYCDYDNQSAVEVFCSAAKTRWNLRVIVGGPQVVALGETFLRNTGCDALVRGEGENPLIALLKHFRSDRSLLAEIPGVTHLDGMGRLISVPPGPPIENLDALPVGKPGKHRPDHSRLTNLAVLTGRGCPFRCAFCYEGSVPGKVRLRSVSHVMMEIRQALDRNPDIPYIWFADDTFTLDPHRVEAFCRELNLLRSNHPFVWFCECHPSTLIRWPEMLPMMVDAGMIRMQIGIESGSSSVLKMYRKQASLEEIARIVDLCNRYNLPQLVGNIIVGGAAESRQTFGETLDFTADLLERGPGMMDLTSTFFLPLPETAITRNPSKYHIRVLDPEGLTSINDVAVVETEYLSRVEITAMRLEFTQHICRTMLRLYREKKIPEERIETQFALYKGHGLQSIWFQAVLSHQPELRERYSLDTSLPASQEAPYLTRYDTLLASGAGRQSADIPQYLLEHWRPLRTLDIWTTVDFSRGFPRIGREVLSPLEFELLLHSTGKLPLQKLLKTVYAGFADRFSGYQEFQAAARSVLHRLEHHRWMVYTNI